MGWDQRKVVLILGNFRLGCGGKIASESLEQAVAEEKAELGELDEFLAQFGGELEEAEQELSQIRDRHAQVIRDRQKRKALGNQVDIVRPDRDLAKNKAVRQQLTNQLKALQENIAELDLAMESRLFAESGFNEVFWQAVRFGGLGVVIGWLLERWIG